MRKCALLQSARPAPRVPHARQVERRVASRAALDEPRLGACASSLAVHEPGSQSREVHQVALNASDPEPSGTRNVSSSPFDPERLFQQARIPNQAETVSIGSETRTEVALMEKSVDLDFFAVGLGRCWLSGLAPD